NSTAVSCPSSALTWNKTMVLDLPTGGCVLVRFTALHRRHPGRRSVYSRPMRRTAARADGERAMTTRGELIPAQETMPGSPGLEFEFVPHKNNLKKIYLRLNGKRIAYRGRPNSPRAATWVSIWFGYKVKDNAARDGVVVYFGDVRINYRSS